MCVIVNNLFKISTMKIRFFLLSFFLFAVSQLSISQTLQINNIQACTGDTVIAEITNTSIDTIGAVTIYIAYDTASVSYINMFNFNSQLNGVLYNDIKNLSGQSVGKIAISWVASSNGVNLSSGIFGKIKFKAKNSNSFFQFLPDCEITNYMTNLYNINYVDGSIVVHQPVVIQNQPVLFVNSGQNAIISLHSLSICSKQWQKKVNNIWENLQNNSDYQCVDCDTLSLLSFNNIPNGSVFRCKLNNYCSTIYSDSVTINNTNVSEEKPSVKFSPNPFNESILIKSENAINFLKIYQSDGKLLEIFYFPQNTYEVFINDLYDLSKGLYFVEIHNFESFQMAKKIYKIIKN